MNCISACRDFVLYKDFDCSIQYHPETENWDSIAPLYSFNAAEQIGNRLLEPLARAITCWDEADTQIERVYSIAVGGIACFAGAMGAVFKVSGEYFNPDSQLRSQVLATRIAYITCAQRYEADVTAEDWAALDVERLYNILWQIDQNSGQSGISETQAHREISQWEPYCIIRNHIEERKRPSTELSSLQAQQLAKACIQFNAREENGLDSSQEAKALLDIVQNDTDRQPHIQRYIAMRQGDTTHKQQLAQLGAHYNALALLFRRAGR